ncbi:hypothetical protein [Isoptericola sp. b408]|uniref:hypothetical protein n=1 Tax=Isoptericola sp. b408 TaxID=3064653 RepID=UPI00271241E0|nr:hypothetical protein [Isoptericola sp. b408]MDO8149892.1 hypothetical protein [Isoptericola sp. b408]
MILGGSWSAHYDNGYAFSNDIPQGFDGLEIDDAAGVGKQQPNTYRELNPQGQVRFHG